MCSKSSSRQRGFSCSVPVCCPSSRPKRVRSRQWLWRYPTVLNPPTTTQPYTNRNLQQPNPTRITQMSRPKKDMSMVEKEMEFLRAPARYLNTLSEIQDKLFQVFGAEDGKGKTTYKGFYEFTGNLEEHTTLFHDFADCFEKTSLPSVLTIYAQWDRLRSSVDLSKAYSYHPNDVVMTKQLECAKLMAGLLILNGHYLEAMHCLMHVVRISPLDTHSWYLLLRWLLWLDEREMLKVVMEAAFKATRDIRSRDSTYAALLKVADLYYRLLALYPSSDCVDESEDPSLTYKDARTLVKNLMESLKETDKTRADAERTTYAISHATSMIREVLVLASRLPATVKVVERDEKGNDRNGYWRDLVDLKMIGDPLKNRSEQLETCDMVLRSRFPDFYNSQESRSSLLKKAGNPDEFLKICAAIADYVETSCSFALECLDTGLTRDVEAHCVATLKYTIPLGIPYRFAQPAAVFLYEKSMLMSLEREMFVNYVAMIGALFTPRNSSKNLPAMKADVLRDNEKAGAVDLEKLITKFRESTLGHNKSTRSDDKENFELLVKEVERLVLDGHVSRCVCGFCSLLNNDPLFAMLCAWLRMAGRGFTLEDHRQFMRRADTVSSSATSVRIELAIDIGRLISSDPRRPTRSAPLQLPTSHLLPSIAELRIRSFITRLLASPEEAIIHDEESIRSSLRICNRSVLKHRGHQLLLRHFELAPDKEGFGRAYDSQKAFGHLFFREWRSRNCVFMASYSKLANWHKALYWIETATPCVRQYARLVNHKKKELDARYHYDNTASIQEAVQRLPADFTLINLAMDAEGSLVVSRLHQHYEPVVATIGNVNEGQEIVEKVRQLLVRSEESLSHSDDAEKFWRVRRALDHELKLLVSEVQERWLSDLYPLFMPFDTYPDWMQSALRELDRKFEGAGFSPHHSAILTRALDKLGVGGSQQWIGLMEKLAELDRVGEELVRKIGGMWVKLRGRLFDAGAGARLKPIIEVEDARPYVLLVVPPALSFLPWECMPLFDGALVTRVPSFHTFENLLHEIKDIPKQVDARRAFYVLNPGGDLEKTQERLTTFINKFKWWNGLVAQVPTRDQVTEALEVHDLFLYMGHGSGGRYFGRSSIRESKCRAVSILMGCCSARIQEEGPNFDGRSSLYEYLIAKCPCVIGCLWTVTDGDIDRFFMALVNSCFSQLNAAAKAEAIPTPLTRAKTKRLASATKKRGDDLHEGVAACRILLQGIVEARKACKLPYLTGGSVTSYGLPISSLLQSPAARRM